MRLRCLLGLHEMVEYDRVSPPRLSLPTFVLKECKHCPHLSYDMEYPK